MPELYFSKVKKVLRDACREQGFSLPRGFMGNFLSALSKCLNYCEEGKSYRPEIVLTHTFDAIHRTLRPCPRFLIKRGKRSGMDMMKCLKPIIPFCENGWLVYIDVQPDHIEYGIIRKFSGIHGLTAVENIFDGTTYEGAGLLHFHFASQTDLIIRPLNKTESITITVGFSSGASYSTKGMERLIDGITSGIGLDHKAEIKASFKNFFNHCLQNIHGTIIAIIDDDGHSLKEGYLKDGLWLDECIDMADAADASIFQDQNDTGDRTGSELFYGLCGLTIKMTDFDGITVFRNNGKILAYNCFVHEATQKKVAGGARRRAFASLCDCGDPSLVGVYFQSQDGHSDYHECERNQI